LATRDTLTEHRTKTTPHAVLQRRKTSSAALKYKEEKKEKKRKKRKEKKEKTPRQT
jgi:hypothetical protein